MHRPRTSLLAIATVAVLALACADQDNATGPPPPQLGVVGSCVDCHTNYEALMALADPDTVTPPEGCGGPAPHVEPYDRVYLSPTGFAAFQASVHGMECTVCHRGHGTTDDKALAHSGDFVKHPSAGNAQACSHCHSEMAPFSSSLHKQGWGQKNSQVRRMGVGSFEQLPEGIRSGYQKNCATCHASTCGDCHVTRPLAGGGGLLDGHRFQAPDMRSNCTACHESRGGHAFFGVGPGTQPDVHLTQAGFTCTSCHSKAELHGDRRIYEHRYQVQGLPACQDCHADLVASNAYHVAHVDDLNCQTCHSQDYNTCGSCHVGGDGARIHSHLSFKIGVNPLPEERPYRLAPLRRTPAAPDTWSAFDVGTMPHFDEKPLYNYTTPHNILRWTSRTRIGAGESCWSNCHILKEGDVYRNSELYLFTSDFTADWERSAVANVAVDGKLPASWETPR